jgi:hypothetical protein
MFYLEDWELPQATLDILEDDGLIDKDGFIWFPNERKQLQRAAFNSCQLYLLWMVEDSFGVQVIKIGTSKALGRGGWRARLRKKRRAPDGKWVSYADLLVEERAAKLRAVFPTETVTFDFLGWSILHTNFWIPKGTTLADPTDLHRKFKMVPNAANNSCATVEKKPND